MSDESPKSPRRIIAIGDIHGCALALEALVGAIDPDQHDIIVPLGDYIDRGPDSKGVIEQMIALAKRTQLVPLIGNHEVMMLSSLDSVRSGRFSSATHMWLSCGGQETMESYGGHPDDVPDEHIQFLKDCRRYYETDSHMFVHANYDSKNPLDQQNERTLLWTHLTISLPKPHVSGKTVVVGHTPQPSGEILDLGHVIGIDTFCVGSGWLTAIDVLTMDVWQADKDGCLREPNDSK
jgi:serine/threonine protein phosphatase 1